MDVEKGNFQETTSPALKNAQEHQKEQNLKHGNKSEQSRELKIEHEQNLKHGHKSEEALKPTPKGSSSNVGQKKKKSLMHLFEDGDMKPAKEPLAIEVENLYVGYGTKTTLFDINLQVSEGSVFGLHGSSGCGKTTLLNCIIGIKSPWQGKVRVFGQELNSKMMIPGNNCGYMPHDPGIHNDLTIIEICEFYGSFAGMSKQDIFTRSSGLIELFKLPHRDRFVGTLSGGQTRRLSLLLALLPKPPLLILDEPTGGMDYLLREKITSFLWKLVHKHGTTLIITSHNIMEIEKADRIGFMRNGKLLVTGDPDEITMKCKMPFLEDVFFQLCQEQDEAEGPKVYDPPGICDRIFDYISCRCCIQTSVANEDEDPWKKDLLLVQKVMPEGRDLREAALEESEWFSITHSNPTSRASADRPLRMNKSSGSNASKRSREMSPDKTKTLGKERNKLLSHEPRIKHNAGFEEYRAGFEDNRSESVVSFLPTSSKVRLELRAGAAVNIRRDVDHDSRALHEGWYWCESPYCIFRPWVPLFLTKYHLLHFYRDIFIITMIIFGPLVGAVIFVATTGHDMENIETAMINFDQGAPLLDDTAMRIMDIVPFDITVTNENISRYNYYSDYFLRHMDSMETFDLFCIMPETGNVTLPKAKMPSEAESFIAESRTSTAATETPNPTNSTEPSAAIDPIANVSMIGLEDIETLKLEGRFISSHQFSPPGNETNNASFYCSKKYYTKNIADSTTPSTPNKPKVPKKSLLNRTEIDDLKAKAIDGIKNREYSAAIVFDYDFSRYFQWTFILPLIGAYLGEKPPPEDSTRNYIQFYADAAEFVMYMDMAIGIFDVLDALYIFEVQLLSEEALYSFKEPYMFIRCFIDKLVGFTPKNEKEGVCFNFSSGGSPTVEPTSITTETLSVTSPKAQTSTKEQDSTSITTETSSVTSPKAQTSTEEQHENEKRNEMNSRGSLKAKAFPAGEILSVHHRRSLTPDTSPTRGRVVAREQSVEPIFDIVNPVCKDISDISDYIKQLASIKIPNIKGIAEDIESIIDTILENIDNNEKNTTVEDIIENAYKEIVPILEKIRDKIIHFFEDVFGPVDRSLDAFFDSKDFVKNGFHFVVKAIRKFFLLWMKIEDPGDIPGDFCTSVDDKECSLIFTLWDTAIIFVADSLHFNVTPLVDKPDIISIPADLLSLTFEGNFTANITITDLPFGLEDIKLDLEKMLPKILKLIEEILPEILPEILQIIEKILPKLPELIVKILATIGKTLLEIVKVLSPILKLLLIVVLEIVKPIFNIVAHVFYLIAQVCELWHWARTVGLVPNMMDIPKRLWAQPLFMDNLYGNEEQLSFFQVMSPGGLVVFLALFGTSLTAIGMKNEEMRRILDRMEVHGVRSLETIVSHYFVNMLVVGILQTLIIMTVYWLGGVVFPAASVIPVFLVLQMTIFEAISFGFLFNTLAFNEADVVFLLNVIPIPLTLSTGTVWPREAMPDWLYSISTYLPMTTNVELLKDLMNRRLITESPWLPWAILSSVVYTILATGTAALLMYAKRKYF